MVQRFERDGRLLTRTYNEEIGASVAEAFGTEDRRAVESYCRAHAIQFEWPPDGVLRTRQRRSAVVCHPVTGRRCWFNQIAFLNQWTLDPEVREFDNVRTAHSRVAYDGPREVLVAMTDPRLAVEETSG